MSPTPPKREEDISDVLESWLEEVSIIQAYGPSYSLPAMYKITSLRVIMDLKRDKFDDMLQSCESEENEETKYNYLVKAIRQYASNRRLEASSKKLQPQGDTPFWCYRNGTRRAVKCFMTQS